METKYTFSLNGSDWQGEFKTRSDARSAAIDAAHQQAETPGVVYVGKIVPADPQTNHHATAIVRAMHDRATQLGVNHYLQSLRPEQIQELDAGISQTLQTWLQRQNLLPTQFSVKAISEYPVRNPAGVIQPAQKEVNEIGPTRQSA